MTRPRQKAKRAGANSNHFSLFNTCYVFRASSSCVCAGSQSSGSRQLDEFYRTRPVSFGRLKTFHLSPTRFELVDTVKDT